MMTRRNRLLGLVLVLAMLLTTIVPSFAALAEGTAQVTFVSSVDGALKPGDTFTVTPTIANNPGFAGVTWKLDYDSSALELVEIINEDDAGEVNYILGAGTFVGNTAYAQAGSNMNNIVFARAKTIARNGVLCALTFKVREDAAAGDYTVNVLKSDADFKFVALDSVNVPVDFTPCTVTVGGGESAYANAQIVYCKDDTYIPVGDTLYINNWAKTDGDKQLISEYKIAVLNNDAIVSEMADDKWTVEGDVFKTAAHTAGDPDGVFTVNATNKAEDAAGKITATLPDGSTLSANVLVTKTPWKISASGVEGLEAERYRKSTASAYASIGDTFKFTYLMQTATNGSIKGTNVKLNYKSSNPKVATIAEDGTITAIGEGHAQITASAIAYNYGVATEIALLINKSINVYVDPDFVTGFVLADADGVVKTHFSQKDGSLQLDMNAGDEITLFPKALPDMRDATCAGTIAAMKQFTVKTSKTALTATTNADGSVTLKAENVTENTEATLSSPQYYRSRVDSSNLWAEQFTLNVKIQAPPDYSKAYLAVRQGKGTDADPYTYQPIGDETVYLNAHGAVGGMQWIANAGIFAMLGDKPIEGVTWALDNTDNVMIDTLNAKLYAPGVCVNASARGGKIGSNALTATLPNDAQLTAKLEMVYLADKMTLTGIDGADIFNTSFTGTGVNRQANYAGSVGSQFTPKYNLLCQSVILKDADRLATNHIIYRSTNESVATVDANGVVTIVGEGEATINTVIKARLALQDQELVSAPIHVQAGNYATDYNWYKNGEKLVRDYDVSSSSPNTYIYTKTSVVVGQETEFTVKSLPEGTTVSIVEDSVSTKDASTVEVTRKDATTLIIKGLKESEALTQVSVQLDRGTGKSSAASIYVTVEAATVPAVESVTLDKSALSLTVEDTDQLKATVLPADADQSILWTSSNEQVATVSKDGEVTAIAAGTATITAKSALDETKLATCEVTVAAKPDYSNAYLAYCKGSRNAYEFIPVGDTIHINNWANGANFIQEYRIAVVNNDEIVAEMPNENWKVENKDNVFMNAYHDSSDPDGVFYINAHGKAEGATGSITAVLPDGSTLKANVIVTESASKILINGVDGIAKKRYSSYSAFPAIGDTFKFTYVLYNASSNKVTSANTKFIFKSSNTDVVTIDENNTLTAVGEGSAQITVFEQVYCYGELVEVEVATKDYRNTAYKANVYVDSSFVEYITLVDANGDVQGEYVDGSTQPTLTLKAGEEITLWAKGMPGKSELVYSGTSASSKQFKLQSGSGVTVTTNADGSFTLKADDVTADAAAVVRTPGFYRSATNKKGASSFDVNVIVMAPPAAESVEISETAIELKKDESVQLTAKVLPADAKQDVQWSSDNTEIATVSENGTVTAMAEGTAIITARSASDETKLATCEVTVKSNKAIAIERVSTDAAKVYGRTGVDVSTLVKVTTEPAGMEYTLDVDLNSIKNNELRKLVSYDADTHMLSVKNITSGYISDIAVIATLKDDPSVTATVGISINCIKVKVEGLTVEVVEGGKADGKYQIGDTLILKAIYTPANATVQDTLWESRNKAVATVEMLTDPMGESTAKVTIVGEGTAEIGVWPNNNTYSEGYAMRKTYEITVPEQPKVEGLTALLGCDATSVKVGDEVAVNLYVDSDQADETYNAFQFGVSFTENLTYVGFDGLNTESDYNYVDVNGTTVTVSGFGKSKNVSGDTALVTLRFKANAAGEAKVTLPEGAAYANGKSVAVSDDLQKINVLNNEVILNVKKTFAIPVTGGTVNNGESTIPATEGESVSFKPDAPADGKQIDEVRINGEKAAANADGSYTIPNPTENTTVEIVTSTITYHVTFTGNGAGDAQGASTAQHGDIYRFTINKDANYNYSVSASIGGAAVSVSGEYEIAGDYVTGDITIVINKTEKTPEEKMRSVTAYLNDADAKEMTKVAHDAASYAFTNPYAQTAKPYKATVNGAEVAIAEGENGGWTIAGPFAGDVAIYFGGVYNVTRPTGVTGEDTAQYQKDYTFTVAADYASGKPTVTIGGVEYALADGTADENGNVTYVISGASITGDIAITLPEPEATVEVNLYFKAEDANGTAYNVYLVTAKPGTTMSDGRVYAYDGTAMFWSEEYKAFAYLVSVNSAFTAEEAKTHVAAADGDRAQKTIDYSGDVNMSGKTDLNDAQLTYDLYNASYHDFSVVSMEKMLRADVSRDKQIDVADVTAIVAIVRK